MKIAICMLIGLSGGDDRGINRQLREPRVMCELQTRVHRGPGLSWMNISSCLAF